MTITRRSFVAAAAAVPLIAADKPNSKINGVMLGAQSYSFRDLSLEDAIKAYKDIGLSYCELFSGHLEPKAAADKKAWRENVPMDEIRAVKKKFDDAGVKIYAVNYSFRDNFSDKEIQSGFDIAKALGTNIITASSNVTTAKRLDPYASREKVYVAFHNHSRKTPNEFFSAESFKEALSGGSKWLAINFDIGHYLGAGFEPVSFLEENHDRIKTIHIKDKTKADQNVEFGQGDTPIKQVLQVLKTKHYPIPAMIEYEYKGKADSVTEVRKCYEYLKSQLA